MLKRILCVFFIFTIAVFSEPEQGGFAEKVKKILWKGEVNGVYKGKRKIKIAIYWSAGYPALEEIQKELLETKKFDLLQNETHKKIGSLTVREIVKEKVLGAKEKLTIIGDFKSSSKSVNRLISTNVYIASYVDETAYIDPVRYFENRVTHPLKQIIHPKDKKEMVFVEGGFFIYGQGKDSSQDNFNPNFYSPSESNLGDVPSFYMDKYEVTNREYEKYIHETNSNPPSHWKDGKYPSGEKDHPVGPLSYREAEGYSKWAGKRLPTEMEWEKAARGIGYEAQKNRDETITYQIKESRYPYSDNYDSRLCNTRESGNGKTISVFELPTDGASSYGIIGMCGNIAEWTSSWYDHYPGHFQKNKSFGKQFKVIRGGSFASSKKESTVYYRSYGGIPNLAKDRKAGFRLVIDAKSN